MMPFAQALEHIHQTLRMAGYASARIEVHLSHADVEAAQREEDVARAIIEESIHPKMRSTLRSRPLGVVHGVHIYVEGDS